MAWRQYGKWRLSLKAKTEYGKNRATGLTKFTLREFPPEAELSPAFAHGAMVGKSADNLG
jgi:hypothetical protein